MNHKEQLLAALDKIRKDAESDARSTDGMAFTGKTVGTLFGQTLAMIDGLAAVLETVVKENYP